MDPGSGAPRCKGRNLVRTRLSSSTPFLVPPEAGPDSSDLCMGLNSAKFLRTQARNNLFSSREQGSISVLMALLRSECEGWYFYEAFGGSGSSGSRRTFSPRPDPGSSAEPCE